MTRRGRHLLLLAILSAALPLSAQQAPDDPRIQQLEQKLDNLVRQAGELRQEIDRLKAGQPAAPPQAAPAEEDLTKVDVVQTPPAAAAPGAPPATPSTQPTPSSIDQPQSALTDVTTINNGSDAAASKIFNPDISVIGNFFGKAGGVNPFEYGPADPRPAMQLDEAEVAFEAFVDPYAKAKFFLAASPTGLEVEEGYAQFVNLPIDVTAKVGKFKALFGKANTWHTHVRPWVDQPLVIHNFFGDEQLADSGISMSKVIPNSFAFVEGTGEVLRGDVGEVVQHRNLNDLLYNAHLKAFKDFSENTNLEVGGSYARGTQAPTAFYAGGGTNQFAGLDLTYRWKPLVRGNYTGFIGRFEGIVNDRADSDRRLYGWYASGDYQLGQRWFTGLRLDRADRNTLLDSAGEPVSADLRRLFTDRGLSATLTFWPSEFSQIRGQFRRTAYGSAKTVNEILFQLQFAIGAHGAHTF
jgi:hypothetical protein